MPRVKKIEALNIKEVLVPSFNSFGEFLSFNGDKVVLSNMSKVKFPKNLLGFEKFLVHINDIENGVSFFIGERSNEFGNDFVTMIIMPDEKKYTFFCRSSSVKGEKLFWFSKNNFKKWKEKLKCDDVVPKKVRTARANNYLSVSYSVYNLKVDFERIEQISKIIKSDLVQFRFKGDLDIKNPMVSFEKVKTAYADLYK